MRRTDLTVTLPHRAAVWFNRDGAFEIRPLPLALPPLSVTVHWHARFESDPGTRWLRTLVVQTLADPAGDAPPATI